MLKEINIKSAAELLGNFKNKIVGSNKSKASLSIVERIKKYFLNHALHMVNAVLKGLEKNNDELNASIEDNVNKNNKGMHIENNGVALNQISKELKKESKQLQNVKDNTEFFNDLKQNIEDKIGSIEETEAKIQEQNGINSQTPDHNVRFDLDALARIKEENENKAKENGENDLTPIESDADTISNNLENEADKVAIEETVNNQVENTLKEAEESLKNEVNAINEPAKDDMESLVNSLADQISDEISASIKTKIKVVVERYEQKLQEHENKYKTELKKKIDETEKVVNGLAENYEEKEAEFNKKLSEKDEIIEKNEAEFNKKLSEKDKEIERLKVFEQRFMLMSQAFAPVQEAQVVTKEPPKTK